MKHVRKKPKINKSKLSDDKYIPIYKRIDKVISKRQHNLDLLKTQILNEKAEKEKTQEDQELQSSKVFASTKNDTQTSFQSFQDFLAKESRWLAAKTQRNESLRKQKEEEISSLSFKPEISQKNKTIYRSKSKDKKPVWDRLYGLSTKYRKENTDNTNKPITLNKIGSKKVRRLNVSNLISDVLDKDQAAI